MNPAALTQRLPPPPFLGLGVRLRGRWELWRNRAERQRAIGECPPLRWANIPAPAGQLGTVRKRQLCIATARVQLNRLIDRQKLASMCGAADLARDLY